jgi:hypothetical protein
MSRQIFMAAAALNLSPGNKLLHSIIFLDGKLLFDQQRGKALEQDHWIVYQHDTKWLLQPRTLMPRAIMPGKPGSSYKPPLCLSSRAL